MIVNSFLKTNNDAKNYKKVLMMHLHNQGIIPTSRLLEELRIDIEPQKEQAEDDDICRCKIIPSPVKGLGEIKRICNRCAKEILVNGFCSDSKIVDGRYERTVYGL